MSDVEIPGLSNGPIYFEDRGSFKPWHVHTPVIVQVVDSDGDNVTVTLPYVAAASPEAVRITSLVTARKAAVDMVASFHFSQRESQIANLQTQKYSPPLVRFKCESCHNEWDAWVNSEGDLQDPRDCICSNGGCSMFGHPAVLLQEDG